VVSEMVNMIEAMRASRRIRR
jgi:hypothetical protein